MGGGGLGGERVKDRKEKRERKRILSDYCPTLMTSFNSNYFFIPNTATLRGRVLTCDLGKDTNIQSITPSC